MTKKKRQHGEHRAMQIAIMKALSIIDYDIWKEYQVALDGEDDELSDELQRATDSALKAWHEEQSR